MIRINSKIHSLTSTLKNKQFTARSGFLDKAVSQIPPQPAEQVDCSATVRDAVHKLAQANVASLLVVDQQGSVIGIFTERDVLDNVAEQFDRMADTAISEVMTADPAVVY
ncbi:MAG: CBS domain-containing protein [Pirellulaceae bacterium]